jgi:hypothetical protein
VSSPRYRDQVAAGVESEPEDPSASVCKHFQAGEIGIHPQDLPAAYARIDLAITCQPSAQCRVYAAILQNVVTIEVTLPKCRG